MIDWDNPAISIHASYGSLYNRRPGEAYGMGTENLTTSSYTTPKAFLEQLSHNSSIKFKSAVEYVSLDGKDIRINTDWTPYIGQPMFYVVDIKIKELTEEETRIARLDLAQHLWRWSHDEHNRPSYSTEDWARTGMTEAEYERKYTQR